MKVGGMWWDSWTSPINSEIEFEDRTFGEFDWRTLVLYEKVGEDWKLLRLEAFEIVPRRKFWGWAKFMKRKKAKRSNFIGISQYF